MRIVGLDHVQLAMPAGGEAAARAFYGGLLALPERVKPADLAARGGCWFESDGVRLHLGVEAGFRPALKAHPGLLVEDLAALVEALTAAGLETTAATPLDGRPRCYATDPFGNRLELIDAATA